MPTGSIARNDMSTVIHIGASEESAGEGLNGKTLEAEGKVGIDVEAKNKDGDVKD